MRITAKQFWELIPTVIQETGILPEDYYDLITTSKLLQQSITPEIVRDWTMDDAQLRLLEDEIYYRTGLESNYVTQSRDVEWLWQLISETCFKNIEILNDEELEVELKE